MRQNGGFGLFCGWIVVGAAFILLTISAGITYSTPVMFPFFETNFTVDGGQAAFVYSCSQVMAFVVGPFAGSLAEKLGPRMLVGGGLSVLATGLLGSALAQSYGELVFSYGMAVGIESGAIYVPLLGLIQRWFYRRRGLASGLATAGISIGTAWIGMNASLRNRFEICGAVDAATRDEIYRSRHRIYVEQMRLRQKYADQDLIRGLALVGRRAAQPMRRLRADQCVRLSEQPPRLVGVPR